MIEIKNLLKKYNKKIILNTINLKIETGERIALIGQSGCGKSTLLKILTGLTSFDSGQIIINQSELKQKNSDVPLHMKNIGMLFQSAALFDSLSIKENIAFYLREELKITNEKHIEKIVKEKLKLVNMEGYENAMPSELSGGQKKRISLARALSKNPNIMFYDEPTTGLDPILSTSIENLIINLSKKLDVTSLIITHQHSTILRTATKIYMLDDGVLIGPEYPETIQNSHDKKIREFFNHAVI